jgi:hypothetical protein
MMHTTAQALGRAHLADLHRQAQRDALARAARQARRARRQEPGHRASGILNSVTAWARDARAPEFRDRLGAPPQARA